MGIEETVPRREYRRIVADSGIIPPWARGGVGFKGRSGSRGLTAAHRRDHLEVEFLPTEGFVVVADVDLGPLGEPVSLFIEASIHGGLLAAAADGLDLDDVVGPGEQILATLKGLALEVGADSIAEHWDRQLVSNACQLQHLQGRQELRFIDEQAVHRSSHLSLLDGVVEVVAFAEGDRLSR